MGVGGPEGHGIGRAGRQDEVEGVAAGDLVESFGAIHRFWPRLDGRQLDGVGLRFQIEFSPTFGDFGVEGFDAEVEAFGFGAASAVVFGGGEAGEAGEGFGVRGGLE